MKCCGMCLHGGPSAVILKVADELKGALDATDKGGFDMGVSSGGSDGPVPQ